MTKYHNTPTELDGFKFPSKREANRYAELRLLEKAGEIKDLEVHPHYDFIVNGQKIGRGYTADSAYLELTRIADILCPIRVTEDVKGYKVRDWRRTADLFKALYPDRELRIVK